MKKTIKRILSLSFILAMVLSVIPTSAFATMPWGVNKFEYIDQGFVIGENRWVSGSFQDGSTNLRKQDMPFKDYTEGATYSCTSSNTSVLKVTMGDKRVLVTGVAPGTATVNLYKTVNGKTTLIGDSVSTVHQASLYCGANYTHTYGIGTRGMSVWVADRNLDASYTWTVDKPGMKIVDGFEKETIKYYGSSMLYAETPGVYKVTVTETYNGVSRILKTITMNIVPPTVKSTLIMYVGELESTTWQNGNKPRTVLGHEGAILNNQDNDYGIYFATKGIDNLYIPITASVNWDAWDWDKTPVCFTNNGMIWGVKEGTIVIDVYRANNNTDFEFKSGLKLVETPDLTYIGSCTVTVLPASMNPANNTK